MKKILALTSLIFALSVGATAMAADPTEVDNDADGVTYTTANAGGYATVLVQGPDTATDIVYVDQADSVFDASLDLILKAGIDDGKYTIKFGGAGKETTTQEFTLTTNSGSTTDPVVADMTTAATTNNGDGTTNIAFKATVDKSFDAVEFTVTKGENSKTGVLDLKNKVTLTGVAADCAILVSNIPNEYRVTAKLVQKATSNN